MKIPLTRLSNRGQDDQFLFQLNDKLKKYDIELCLQSTYPDIFNFIIIESGGVEGLFKQQIIENVKPPYHIILTNRNNSLAAGLEISTYLFQNNIEHTILIDEDFDKLAIKIKDIILIKTAVRRLKNTNLGVIGQPSDWLIASQVSYFQIKQKFGINMIDISLDEIISIYDNDKDIIYPKYMPIYQIKNPFKKEVLNDAIKVYSALKKIIKKYNLNGLTIRCFDFLNLKKATACLALAILNEEGYCCSCEGDIPSLLTMVLIKTLLNKPSFQANPSYLDYKSNRLVLAHCTIALNMCKTYKFDTHFESDMSIGIKGELTPGLINICKLSSDLKELNVVVGYLHNNLSKPCFCRTQIEVSLYEWTLDQFINAHMANHVLISYDNHQHLLKEFFKEFK